MDRYDDKSTERSRDFDLCSQGRRDRNENRNENSNGERDRNSSRFANAWDDDYGRASGRKDHDLGSSSQDFSQRSDRQGGGVMNAIKSVFRSPKGYERSDERIREDVCETLVRHAEVDPSEIEVKVLQGEVTLSGTVDESRSRRLAEEIVEGLPGVKDVRNEIRVSRSKDTTGMHIEQRNAKGRLSTKSPLQTGPEGYTPH